MRSTPRPPRRPRAALPLAAVAAACVELGGCLPVTVTGTSGRELPLERVRAIAPGVTTARELVEWLGPPLAVGPPGAVLRVPILDVRRAGERAVAARPEAGGWPAAAVGPDDVVYYWEAVEIRDRASHVDVYPGLRSPGSLDRRTRRDRLWVLLSGDGRRVRAVAHDRREEPPLAPVRAQEGPP